MTKRKTVYPSNVIHKTLVSEFTENGAYFEDGTHEIFDEVIYCTGKPKQIHYTYSC